MTYMTPTYCPTNIGITVMTLAPQFSFAEVWA